MRKKNTTPEDTKRRGRGPGMYARPYIVGLDNGQTLPCEGVSVEDALDSAASFLSDEGREETPMSATPCRLAPDQPRIRVTRVVEKRLAWGDRQRAKRG